MIEAKDILIVCYSYSGNTYEVAKEIQRQTGGTLSEIYPKQPYTRVFTTLLEKARKEIEDNYLPSLFPGVESADKYKVIFVGSPNWCGTITPPLASWLDKNDLEGKILIPFHSHCGGGQGNIDTVVKERCPQSIVKDGICIINDGGTNLAKIIAMWIASLDLNM